MSSSIAPLLAPDATAASTAHAPSLGKQEQWLRTHKRSVLVSLLLLVLVGVLATAAVIYHGAFHHKVIVRKCD